MGYEVGDMMGTGGGDGDGRRGHAGDGDMRRGRGRPPRALPSVLAMPVFTLEVLTWLMRFSCSGFTNTTTLMFHSDCMAT